MKRKIALAVVLFPTLIAPALASAGTPLYVTASKMQAAAAGYKGIASDRITVSTDSCAGQGLAHGSLLIKTYHLFLCRLRTNRGVLNYHVAMTTVAGKVYWQWTPIVANPPWQPPIGFTLWTGNGTGKGVVAYENSSCVTGGTHLANGGTDSAGDICWSYVMVSRKACSAAIYAEIRLVKQGIVVGYTDAQQAAPAGQQVQLQGLVSGHPGAKAQLISVSCN